MNTVWILDYYRVLYREIRIIIEYCIEIRNSFKLK